ncbi:S66 family peptidase [Pseudoalteromonas sp. SS15]|uniref:S66 family peptidase n=1 Tax=Pseudoalteromonas sp. SS15 TaxID=3139393 RepID=UPI003BA90BB5
MKIPTKLKEGCKIAVCTFSSPVPLSFEKRFNECIKTLKSKGLNLDIDENVLSDTAISKQCIANSLNKYLSDDKYDAVIPPWGGDFALEVLPLLNWDVIAKSKPKWIFGFSDISTLTTAITSRVGWYTIHSANLMQIAGNENCNYVKLLFDLLFNAAEGYSFEQKSSSFHEFDYPDYKSKPLSSYSLDTLSELIIINNHEQTPLKGSLIGGCIDTLQLTMGSEFLSFENMGGSKNIIAYLENAELSPTQYKRALLSLKIKGFFSNCRCILVGRNKFEYSNNSLGNEEIILKEVFADLKIPVFGNLDIGHVSPNFTLVNGAAAQVNFVKNKIILNQELI